jgi:hypothetical protein
MLIIWLPLTVILSALSGLIMTFISLAVPVGPWMHVTILLVMMAIARMLRAEYAQALYVTSAISVSASVATAMGFCFPTWYFLAPEEFLVLLSNPFRFCMVSVASIGLTAGWAYILASIKGAYISAHDQRSYPVGQLMYTVYSAAGSAAQALQVGAGIAVAGVYALGTRLLALPELFALCSRTVLMTWQVCSRMYVLMLPALTIRVSMGAMFLALGYVSGHVIGVPLLVGAITKYGLLDVLQRAFWSDSVGDDFTFALCSGIVAWSAGLSMMHLARTLFGVLYNMRTGAALKERLRIQYAMGTDRVRQIQPLIIGAGLLTMLSAWYLALRWDLALYVVIASSISAWQIAGIAQRTGLALVGRFATWVMLPGVLLYGINPIYATLFALGVEVCGMLVVDLLFNQMAAMRAGLNMQRVWWWQFLGLIIGLIVCSVSLWWLVSMYGIGQATPLVAQRARSRALLLQVTSFDWSVVMLGMMLSIGMGLLGINSTMALAGILLPLDITLLLVAGGALRLLFADPERWTPFWSGLFAASALGMSLKVFFA